MTETLSDRSTTAGPLADPAVPAQRGHAAWLERLVARVTMGSAVSHETLRSRNDLAASSFRDGRLADAEREFSLTLALCRSLLGEDHADTLVAVGNLAAAHIAAGHPGPAIPLLERAVADRARHRGPDHPATLDARHGLGVALLDAGDALAAGHVLRSTLADRGRILGPDHPDTDGTRGVLARADAVTDARRAG